MRRVVILSSNAAIANPSDRGVLTEANWNTEEVEDVLRNGRQATPLAKYCASKSMAERSTSFCCQPLVAFAENGVLSRCMGLRARTSRKVNLGIGDFVPSGCTSSFPSPFNLVLIITHRCLEYVTSRFKRSLI